MKYLIDLRSRVSAVGDQGRRPTCVSFALSTCHEVLHKLPPKELSKESLHWGCLQRDGVNIGGVKMDTALNVIEQDGQPYEHDWPYRGDVDEMTWLSLPRPDLNSQPKFKIGRAISLQPAGPQELADILESFGPVCLVVAIWESFFMPFGGRISMPDTVSEEYRGNHALCVVAVSTDGEVLLRNSWGRTWGDSGYALIPFEYVLKYSQGLYALTPREISD